MRSQRKKTKISVSVMEAGLMAKSAPKKSMTLVSNANNATIPFAMREAINILTPISVEQP
jgi:hypothetical protein